MVPHAGMLLGIDLGTSRLKVVVIDSSSGRIVGSASREIAIEVPRAGYAEQNPEGWWQGATAAIREATTSINLSNVQGIGLSGQMHGTICLDASHRALRPAILWADTRTASLAAELMARASPADLVRFAPGWPAAGYMALSLMWLKQHEPSVYAETTVALLPKDYLRLRLTGEVSTDFSDASATWLFDIENGQWSDWLLDLCAVDREKLPAILPAWDTAGALTVEAARILGLPSGIPVACGAADMAAQALGNGLVDPGTALVILGTGGQIFHAMRVPRRDDELRTCTYLHAAPERWYAQAAILAGGLCLQWLRDALGLVDRPDAYEQFATLAAKIPIGSEGLIFRPHLAGVRGPDPAPYDSGAFRGLRLHHSTGHLVRAVMEGVAFAMKDCLMAIQNVAVEQSVERILISGGAMESPVWRQILVDVLGMPSQWGESTHRAAVGAALLGGVACGLYPSVEEACAILPPLHPPNLPDPESTLLYETVYRKARQLEHGNEKV